VSKKYQLKSKNVDLNFKSILYTVVSAHAQCIPMEMTDDKNKNFENNFKIYLKRF